MFIFNFLMKLRFKHVTDVPGYFIIYCRLTKYKLKLISAKFLLPMISHNELSITLYTLCLKLLDRVVSGSRFLPGGVFECDLVHRRSVAVLYMLYKIRCNPMYHFYGTTCPVCAGALHTAL